MITRNARTQFPPAIRYAWGYHDALNDATNRVVPMWRRGPVDKHYDQAYVKGYYAGMDAAKVARVEGKS